MKYKQIGVLAVASLLTLSAASSPADHEALQKTDFSSRCADVREALKYWQWALEEFKKCQQKSHICDSEAVESVYEIGGPEGVLQEISFLKKEEIEACSGVRRA